VRPADRGWEVSNTGDGIRRRPCPCIKTYGTPCCRDFHPTRHYVCTLSAGHRGRHKACGSLALNEHNLASWPAKARKAVGRG
jgi:hypothetical protein